MLSVAIGRVLGSALRGRCDARPELAEQPLELTIHVPAVAARPLRSDGGGAALVERLFAPLGWRVSAVPEPYGPDQWGDSPYLDLTLTGSQRLAHALSHLYVLLPVLDGAKHYFSSSDEVDKLIRRGVGWLAAHPEKDLITRRYLARREWTDDALARLAAVVDAVHPDGRTLIFVGDLIDRGPDSVGVLRLAMGMTASGNALAVPGNHEAKLIRALDGAKVQVSHGLETTLAELAEETPEFQRAVRNWCYELVSHLVLDDGRLVIAHAGLKEAYHGRASGRVRSFALYGDTTGETDEFGLPIRYPWAEEYRGKAMVVYGHTPTPSLEWINNTLCLDTGCVFGGELSALRYPERESIQIEARDEYYAPAKPFTTGTDRDVEELRLSDVTGTRYVETVHLGRLRVSAESAAGARVLPALAGGAGSSSPPAIPSPWTRAWPGGRNSPEQVVRAWWSNRSRTSRTPRRAAWFSRG